MNIELTWWRDGYAVLVSGLTEVVVVVVPADGTALGGGGLGVQLDVRAARPGGGGACSKLLR